ncbi:methyl-accepting chemotaxis protein [Marinomonas epiphytica]
MKSIQMKIALVTGLTTLVAILCLSSFSFISNKQLHNSVQHSTQKLVDELFKKQLEGHLENSAQHISNLMQQALLMTQEQARTFASLKKSAESQGTVNVLRHNINTILKDTIVSTPNVIGVYTAWEPNALDNEDRHYKNQVTEGYDHTGRLVPYWTLSTNGAPKIEALLGYDNESYYSCTRFSKQSCLLDPYSYPVNGVDTMMTSIVSPILDSGRFLGIAGVDISLKSFESVAQDLSKALYNGQSQVFIISRNGTVVSDSKGVHSGDNIKDILNEHTDRIVSSMENSSFELLSDDESPTISAVNSIKIGKGLDSWGLWVSVPKKIVMADFIALNQSTNEKQFSQGIWIIVAGLLITALSITLIWWFSGKISKPVVVLTNFMKRVADGNFRERIEHYSTDEIGQLSHACNQFLDQIQPLLKQVVISSEHISKLAEQSAKISSETLQGASQQQGDVIQLASALTELSATAQNVADNTITSAQSTNNMRGNAAQGQEVLHLSNLSMAALSENVKYSGQVIDRVSQDSQEIQTVMDVIREIAEQTNLLALNAAIEAARAGEQGRGFAVVADEVRSLAKRTQDSTSAIQEKIERLQASAIEAVNAMKQGSEKAIESELRTNEANQKLKEILDNIEELNDLIIQVSSAAEQQRSVTDSINANVNNITTIASQTASGATSTNETSLELENHAEHMKGLVSQFKL